MIAKDKGAVRDNNAHMMCAPRIRDSTIVLINDGIFRYPITDGVNILAGQQGIYLPKLGL